MNRLLLLKILTFMLYAGPLLAGLAGQGWGVLPAFAAVFLLWQAVMRPADWPRDPARWAEPAQLGAAAVRIAILVALVALMFGIGRGIGGVAGHLPGMPALLPLALSFLAVPLARLTWDPAKAAEMDALLDQAIARIRTATPPDDEDAAMAIEPLLLLPDDTPDETARAGAADILSRGDAPRRWRALSAALRDAPGAHRATRRGFILWATDPDTARAWDGLTMLTDAFQAAGHDAELLRLYAERALPLADNMPGAWGDFPAPELRVAAAEACGDPEVAALIIELSDRIDAHAPEDSREFTRMGRRSVGSA
ncbi:MAG: hypothetical protein KF887_16430 [Paracoccaceae bacterium]|nr:MAG: hypothetical protein KF887_16430 [Paracoccaceae bacterium]